MAKFNVAAVFSSNMVLQRDKEVAVFGRGVNGENVTVTFCGNTYSGTVTKEQWRVTLPPHKAGTGYEMTVSCKNEEIQYVNIAIGEVWLAGGQSNMEFELQKCTGGEAVLREDSGSLVRFYNTERNATLDKECLEKEERTSWMEFDADSAKTWSAVGYFFGKLLAQNLQVPIGIIGCNVGGTSASCWMSEESLREEKDLHSYLLEYEKKIEGRSEQVQREEYEEYAIYAAKWDAKCAKLFEQNPKASWTDALEFCGKNLWPGPMGCTNPHRPSGLYHSMLERVMPYTIKGFLFYQGESDDHKPQSYQCLLTTMIRQWRKDWEDETLPFLMVQLPMHRNSSDPDYKHWCLIREAQMNTVSSVNNTGLAVALDCGEFNDIHPKDKVPVGERLGLQALYHVYQTVREQDAFGPIYKAFEYKENGIELSFAYADEGFLTKGEVGGFEIAGEDKQYTEAEILLREGKIFVSSPKVKEPKYARYCWTNYGAVTIYGKNGIPLAPFRTSNQDVAE